MKQRDATGPPIWHLLTGEYPPQIGGVGDYTMVLAGALAAAGAEVHVWTTPAAGSAPDMVGVTVHRIAGCWSSADLSRLGTALDEFAPPRLLFIQHVPNAWNYKGLNLGFSRWLVGRRRQGDDVRVMFHEVRYFTRLCDRPTRWLLAAGQRHMVRALLDASEHVYVSIPSWDKLLRGHAPEYDRAITWLPVPSTIAVIDDVPGVTCRRQWLAPGGELIVGSFGSFSPLVAALLAKVLPALLGVTRGRIALLIGQASEDFVAAHSGLSGRLVATGELTAEEVSLHVQACDLMIQPYPDGVSSRRTSVMAALAHGRPVATTQGSLTEPFWADGGVALAPADAPACLVAIAERLLADARTRERLGAEGRAIYERSFAIRRTVETLLRTR